MNSKEQITSKISDAEAPSSVPCGICRRQFSRYTCPKCNLLYCSLPCFRSQAHSDCSEGFYRAELETDIRTNPNKSNEERQRMMDVLKRFEEEAAENADEVLMPDESDDEEDLASRLSDVDLASASYGDLWDVLTPAQRQKFLSALNDPSSEIAQAIFSSQEFSEEIVQPWWDRPDETNNKAPTMQGQRFGNKPQLVDIPPPVLNAASHAAQTGPSLLYNIFAVLIAYAHVTRTFSMSPLTALPLGNPEYDEARHTLSALVPFLLNRKSTAVLSSLSGLITDLWSRFEPENVTPSLFALLMRDAATLLRPASVVALSSAPSGPGTPRLTDHPSVNALLALSDLSVFFQQQRHSQRPKQDHCTAKLAFYAARIVHTPTYILSALANEALAHASLIEREGMQDQQTQLSPHPSMKSDPVRPQIEELS